MPLLAALRPLLPAPAAAAMLMLPTSSNETHPSVEGEGDQGCGNGGLGKTAQREMSKYFLLSLHSFIPVNNIDCGK